MCRSCAWNKLLLSAIRTVLAVFSLVCGVSGRGSVHGGCIPGASCTTKAALFYDPRGARAGHPILASLSIAAAQCRLVGVVWKTRQGVKGSNWARERRARGLAEAMTDSSSRDLHLGPSHESRQARTSASDADWGTPALKVLADRLRHYRAPASSWAPADDETHGGVTSSVGMPTSVASANDIKASPKSKRAAVLLCLFQGAEGELRVILTKRAGCLSSHSGEVALPGGKRDEGEDDKATALREAHEEIGLEPSHVRIVTVLEPFLSKHLLTVTPVVGIVPEHHKFEPRPNAGEVDAIFDVPLEMFLKDERHRTEDRQWLDVQYRVHFFDYDTPDGKKFTIWGLTASILIHAASIILQRQPDFPEFWPDFDALTRHVRDGKGSGNLP